MVNAEDTKINQHINPQNKYKKDNNTPSSFNTKFRFKQINKEVVVGYENKYSASLDEIQIKLEKQSLPLIPKRLITHITNSSLVS